MRAIKSGELTTLLKRADPHLRKYVSALEKENGKLQREIVRLEANQVTLNNRVKELDRKLRAGGTHMRITFPDGSKIG